MNSRTTVRALAMLILGSTLGIAAGSIAEAKSDCTDLGCFSGGLYWYCFYNPDSDCELIGSGPWNQCRQTYCS